MGGPQPPVEGNASSATSPRTSSIARSTKPGHVSKLIPADLAPGDYVLQWRWDCEESDQIWASCADVTVVA